jgi:Bacterial Ig-like domain (group 1)
MRRHGVRWSAALVAAASVALLTAGAAGAAITTVTNDPTGAGQVAASMAGAGANILGASFTMNYLTAPANGVADSPLGGFPTTGGTFGILTTGDVQLADNPNTSPSSGLDQNGGSRFDGTHLRGNTDFDATVLKIDLLAQPGANCLTFDFKFFSEEFPEFVNTQYNDAFIAELDASTWTTNGSAIIAPNNFAFDPTGNVISINAAGNTSMTAGNAAGTTYDGATPLLSASTQVTPGAHSLYLSIFDQGDQIFDSAVFLDNLRVGFVPNPAVNCKPGAQPVNFRLTLAPPSDENLRGQSHTVTATLTDDSGAPVAGATIQFEVTGANTTSGPGVTNASGQATFTYVGANLGDDTITACYNADSSPDGSCEAVASATKRWVIGPPASLVLTPPTATNVVDAQHCVTATVRDAASNPTPGITVRFSVTGSVTTSGSQVTNASGQATFCYTGPALPGADVITAYADTNTNNTQDAGEPSGTAAKTWVIPTSTAGCKVTYGGRITAGNGDKATLGGNAQAPAKGQEEYQDHGAAAAMNVHSINVQAVTCSADGTSASIFGQATIDGAGTYDYRIDLKDLGEPGSSDTYRIRLSNGYDSGEQTLEGGNVQIHT